VTAENHRKRRHAVQLVDLPNRPWEVRDRLAVHQRMKRLEGVIVLHHDGPVDDLGSRIGVSDIGRRLFSNRVDGRGGLAYLVFSLCTISFKSRSILGIASRHSAPWRKAGSSPMRENSVAMNLKWSAICRSVPAHCWAEARSRVSPWSAMLPVTDTVR
jgi:hypothetical protein